MKICDVTLICLCLAPLLLRAQDVTTQPIGFNKVTCLTNSDTIVGVPLRQQGSLNSVLTAPPVVNGDSATLTFATDSLSAGALTGHYLKFIDGDRAGRWYDIQTATTGTENTSSALTISLNGDSLGTATTGNQVLIARYWTINELFPPVASTGVTGPTTSWTFDSETGLQVPNGHAIVSSSSTSLRNRRTELLLPDLNTPSTNLSASSILYITGNAWVDAAGTPNAGDRVLWPDTYLTIRHPAAVSNATIFRTFGEVDIHDGVITLRSSLTGARDNFIGLMRPLGVRLDALNLLEGGAFVSSAGTSLRNRRDQLLVFDNAVAIRNRSASAIFYHDGTNWLDASNNSLANDRVIQAGYGFIIRKAKSTSSTTSFWRNPPNY